MSLESGPPQSTYGQNSIRLPDGPNLEVSRYIQLNHLPGIPSILMATVYSACPGPSPKRGLGSPGGGKTFAANPA